MTSLLFKNKRRDLQSKGSSALIITLVVMVLITLLVVSLSSMVGVERITSHSSFENEKARQFGQMAIDEALATLKDNIPASNQWAAAPGHLYVYTSQSAYTNIFLFSGQTNGSATGSVDLNSPVLGGSSGYYPIVPTNSEYGSTPPQMQVAWVDVLQDGTIIRSTSSTSVTSANPIVGRYAYWVDTENAKVNINTAGRGQTFYNAATNVFSTNYPSTGSRATGLTNQYNSSWSTADAQNLSGSPSRVDLSLLDGGITPAQSLATYHYTYGGYFAGDYLSNYDVGATGACFSPVAYQTNSGTTTASGAIAYGMQKFNSIWDWAQLSSDPLLGSSSPIRPVTQSQIEQNLFYLTVKSRTPEVLPLGPNKMWLQEFAAEQRKAFSVVAPGGIPYGNISNLRGPSGSITTGYPLGSASNAEANPPLIYPGDTVTDTRYYCFPWGTNSVLTTPIPDGQWIAPYGAQTFVTYFMKQLSRTDWPGMPAGKSFVSKYGETECEDMALNLFWLWDTTVFADGPNPSGFGGGLAYDPGLHYGQNVIAINSTGTTPLATSTSTGRLTGGHLAMATGINVPYINEIAVTFTPTTNGYTAQSTGTETVNYANTTATGTLVLNLNYTDTIFNNALLQTTTTGGPMWTTTGNYTKDGLRPGFVPGIYSTIGTTSTYYLTQAGTGNSYVNVAMSPYIQVYYPPGFKDTFFGASTGYYLLDFLVTASGQWTPPPVNGVAQPTLNVQYGGYASSNNNGALGKTPDGGAQYYWGLPDDHPSVVPTTAISAQHWQQAGEANGLQLRNVANGQTSANFTPGSYVTMGYGTWSSGAGTGSGWNPAPIYIGPFNAGSTPKITIQFRTVSVAPQINTGVTPLQIIPLGANYGTAVSTTEPAGFGSSVTSGHASTSDGYGYTNVMVGTNGYSGTLSFPLNTTNSLASGCSPGMTGPSLTLTGSTQRAVTYEATDPRVFKYVSDWNMDVNPANAVSVAGSEASTSGSITSILTGISPGTSFSSYSSQTTSDPLNPWVSSLTPEDDSKFAFTQSPYQDLTFGMITGNFHTGWDPRWTQFANNITQLPGIGWLSTLPLNIESSQGTPNGTNELVNGSGTSANVPVNWRTLNLGPTSAGDGNLPDWLILEAFAIAYDQTYLSQTDGKINVNGGNIYPFGFTRTKPMQALLMPASYTNNIDNPGLDTNDMVNDLASSSFSGNGDYTAVSAWNVPNDAFVYPEQIAQMKSLQNTNAASVAFGSPATNQWQRESVMRNILGTITTKCSDFKVHIIAQSVKQLSGSSTPAAANLQVTGEQRMSALISRETNVGANDIPDATPPATYTDAAISSYVTYYPGFRYVVSDIEYINN